jgi:hypothetical protein
MTTSKLFFLIADISGYTKFIKSLSHKPSKADKITRQLLESVLEASSSPLIAHEIEGDAIFFYAISDDSSNMANIVYQQALHMFNAFEKKKYELMDEENDQQITEALQTLKLKAILHHGKGIMGKIQHFNKVSGEDMILVHRLLKNSITYKEYILLSQSFYELANINFTQEPQHFKEYYQDLGYVKGMVYSANYELAAVS